MKHFIQFYINAAITPKLIIPACGSDPIYWLDNRNNLANMVKDAHERVYRLRKVQAYKYFTINSGTINNSTIVYKSDSLVKAIEAGYKLEGN